MSVPKLSVEEYLRVDRAAELKSEYHDGDMFPIAAVSLQHAVIVPNVCYSLIGSLKGGRCRVASSPIRVRVSPTKFVYPDIMVYCEQPDLTDEVRDTITNPKVIVEILSPSTADYDYGGKFTFYRLLASFEEYLLVAQDQPRVEVFRKMPDSRWLLTTYEGLEASVKVESVEISLPLSEFYAGVETRQAYNA